jgi:anti-sigma factor (TIGR02949 family)
MNCVESGRLLNAYSDGELDLQAALAVEDHLERCARCRAASAGLCALRSALSRACEPEPAPAGLRARVLADLDRTSAAPARGGRRWNWLAAAPGIAALLIVGWFALARPWQDAASPPADGTRVVYHIANAGNVEASLRTLRNHLDAAPGLRVVVVAHNAGVDFLMRGARDETGQPFADAVHELRTRGVEFRVCTNTLTRRQIDGGSVIPDAVLVPSGIAEVSRLQGREGYVYLRL